LPLIEASDLRDAHKTALFGEFSPENDRKSTENDRKMTENDRKMAENGKNAPRISASA
jgi:hypothetical protein